MAFLLFLKHTDLSSPQGLCTCSPLTLTPAYSSAPALLSSSVFMTHDLRLSMPFSPWRPGLPFSWSLAPKQVLDTVRFSKCLGLA